MSRKYEYDGAMVKPTEDQIQPGVVLRFEKGDGCLAAFSDSVVLKVANRDVKEYSTVDLARPYLYASSTETTSPTAMTGVEKYSVLMSSVLERAVIVLLSTGKPAKYLT